MKHSFRFWSQSSVTVFIFLRLLNKACIRRYGAGRGIFGLLHLCTVEALERSSVYLFAPVWSCAVAITKKDAGFHVGDRPFSINVENRERYVQQTQILLEMQLYFNEIQLSCQFENKRVWLYCVCLISCTYH